MKRVCIVGHGRIGRALALAKPKPDSVSGRALVGAADRDFPGLLADAEVVVHAAGRSGEAVAVKDPVGAFALHFTLTERLVRWTLAQPSRQLILIGTVAPDVGFYGPLKRAAVRTAQRMMAAGEATDGQLFVVEAGHVIGEGMSVHDSPGVVARFIASAVTGQPLVVPTQPVTIRLTPLDSLVKTIMNLIHVPDVHPTVVAPVSEAERVVDIAKRVATLVGSMRDQAPVPLIADARMNRPSYAEPLGAIVPVRPLSDTLFRWLHTLEVKMLFKAPSGRVLRDG